MGEVENELVDALARVARIHLPDEDRELLRSVLENQLQAIRRLEGVDVENVEPIVSFDPRWR
jgi:aspartyl/glutamyl-tRNA(Asn/Gln) amidotransferase C subunit